MKFWNELEGSTFLGKVFSTPIAIGNARLYSLQIENEQSGLGMGIDIQEFPDQLPEKWKNKGFNTCRIGLSFQEISKLTIKNVPCSELFLITIKKEKNLLNFEATSKSSSIKFTTKHLSLCGPFRIYKR